MLKMTKLLGWLLPLLLTAGCAGVSTMRPGAPAAAVDPRITQAGARFGLGLFHQLRTEKPGQNLFISPASVSLALSMTANGAAGATRAAMAKTLGVDGIDPAELNQGHAALQSVLANPDPKVQLAIANSIWYARGQKVAPAFQEASRTYYKAEALPLDFSSPEAAKTMNNWVAKATKQKIDAIVSRTDEWDRMYLINAIYFNGQWQEPFNAALTRPQTFTTGDDAQVQAPMMNRSGTFRYLKGEQFQAAALPYGDGRLSLYLFVPDSGVSLEQFYSSLTPENWESWLSMFAPREGAVTLPKVTLTYEAQLKPTLISLGMATAFGPEANFNGLFEDSKEDLFISSVLHKTFLEISEKGTEAAAVTAVTVRATSAAPATNRFSLVADRPFFFAIRDDQTGAMLFVGSILKP